MISQSRFLIKGKTILKNFIRQPLFSGSLLMLVGTNFSNFMAYLYHFVLGRILTPAEYGEVVAILSILALAMVGFAFINTVIVKLVASSKKKEIQKIIFWFNRKIVKITPPFFLLSLILIPLLSRFLRISVWTVFLVAPIILLSTYSMIFRAVLQGLLKFKEVVVISNVETFARLLLGVIFVLLGWSSFGAVFGIFTTSFLVLILSWIFLKDFRVFGSKGSIDFSKFMSLSVPIFFASIGINSFFSSDLILVKHFFQSREMGIYASLSALGKIIFFGASPVVSVMFPLASRKHSRGEAVDKIFYLSFMLTLTISLVVLCFYYFFPQLSVRMLFGERYLEASRHLFWFGLFMTFFTLDTLLINFFISKNKVWVSYLIFIFALLQIFGIVFWHSGIMSVVLVSLFLSIFLFLILVSYFFYETKKDQ